MTDSHTRYPDDYKYAQLLLSGDTEAWDRLYKEFRKKLKIYINQKYPDVFSDIAVEEICDGVWKRFMENDYKAIRDYRGECTFSTYITKATDWEIKDWLRRHSDELFSEPIDSIGNDGMGFRNKESVNSVSLSDEEEVPDSIKSLTDDLRWAFLLRYYDYFGFPFSEIRLLAKKKGVSIGSITEKIINFLEPEGQDILRVQREKQAAFQLRIQRLCVEIQNVAKREQELLAKFKETGLYCERKDEDKSKKLDIIRDKRIKLGRKRNALLKNRTRLVISTPYEVIADILGESNVSTIRSRVFLAKEYLKQKLFKEKNKTFYKKGSS